MTSTSSSHLSDVESCQGTTYICSIAYMYAFWGSLSESRRRNVTVLGIGGISQTHFWDPKASGLCYFSEATQGRIPLCVCSCEMRSSSSSSQVHLAFRNVFLPAIPIVIRCGGVEVPCAISHDVFGGIIPEGVPLAQGNHRRL